jgi:hypothetical protein
MPTKVTPFTEEHLYRTETFVDEAAGWITAKVPVYFDGSIDLRRLPVFRGATILSGKVRIEFDLPGPTLNKAIEGWTAACTKAVEAVQSEMLRGAILDGSGQPITQPQA